MSIDTSVADHRQQVVGSFDSAVNPRVREVLQAAVRHLHAFVEEVSPSRDEWRAAVDFLTSVGHRCEGDRQEFILLSDTLGVSMLVEMLNERHAPGATEPTVLGPFHVPDAPRKEFGASIVDDPDTGGEPMTVRGTVRDLGGAPVPGATVEVWQVQPDRRYDIEDDLAKRNLRGVFRARPDGGFEFRTVRPVDYTIPDDGPVGAMLRAGGRASWRPAHLHFAVRAQGFFPIVTHVFDALSPWLADDAVFGVRPSLIVPMDGGECHFDPVLERRP